MNLFVVLEEMVLDYSRSVAFKLLNRLMAQQIAGPTNQAAC